MNIREMELCDYDSVDLLLQQLHKLHVNGRPELFVDVEHICPKEKFEKLINDENVISILAENEDSVTGICFAEIRNRSAMVDMTSVFITDLIVKDLYRRQGIANALFSAIEEQAKNKGAQRIDLNVWSFNEDAIAFYKKIGMSLQKCIYEKRL